MRFSYLNLIIINVLVFVAQKAFGSDGPTDPVTELFALHHYKSDVFKPYQIVTHMFMHGSFFHLLFNMFALWMFGTMVERVWEAKKFFPEGGITSYRHIQVIYRKINKK